MLSKRNRLKKSSSFQNVHRKGRHIPGKYGKLIVLRRNDENESRFGVVVSADKGNAVKRNRAKRMIRHAFRDVKEKNKGLDLFYVVWKVEFSFDEIKKEIEKGLSHEIHNNGSH